MQNLPLHFSVLEYSLFMENSYHFDSVFTRKYDVVFLSQSFYNLAVEQREPSDHWHQGARQQEDSEDGHAVPDGQHPWGMVDRARAGDSAH